MVGVPVLPGTLPLQLALGGILLLPLRPFSHAFVLTPRLQIFLDVQVAVESMSRD